MGSESKKRCSSLEQPRGNFYKTFHLQKSFEIFEKNSAEKTWSYVFVRAENALSHARQG